MRPRILRVLRRLLIVGHWPSQTVGIDTANYQERPANGLYNENRETWIWNVVPRPSSVDIDNAIEPYYHDGRVLKMRVMEIAVCLVFNIRPKLSPLQSQRPESDDIRRK